MLAFIHLCENHAAVVEGTFKFAGGNGKYRGIIGGVRFKSVLKSETELECTWDGNYEPAKSKAA